MFVFDIFSFCR